MTSKRNVMLIALLAFTLVASAYAQQNVGDSCRLNDGAPGVCRSLLECESAQLELDSDDDVTLAECGYVGHTMIVCCALSDSSPHAVQNPSKSQGTFPGRSWDKCLEYSNAVNQTVQQPTFTINRHETKESTCAIVGQKFIIGGIKSEPKEFPHMAALGFGKKDQEAWLCGGSLISPRFVVTAAHCIFARYRGRVRWARLGDLNLKAITDDSKPATYAVEKIIKHPDYKSDSHYNDIALLKLDTDVIFNAYVRPACLNTFRDTPKGQTATATGWGVVSWTNEKGSDDLMKVDLKYDSPQRCNQTFASLIRTTQKLLRGFTDDTMICAGDPEGKKDTCVGDSGGPLQIILQHPYYCMYSIVGLTSFGSKACGESNSPAVYTRVSHYVPWIEGIVWPTG